MVDKLMKIYPSPKAEEGLREGLRCQGHPQLAPVPPEHLLVSHPHPGARLSSQQDHSPRVQAEDGGDLTVLLCSLAS